MRELLRLWKPPARMTVSEWADSFGVLPSDSAEPGRFKINRTPYMKEVVDAFTDPSIKKIVVKSAAQIGKSTAILNIIGRTVHLNPANIMLVQPTLSDAEDFSKARLSKYIKDCKVLTPLFYEKEKTRDANQTILSKFFKGGRIVLVGANSPSGLASRPIKILLCDETDRYPPTASKEGDPIDIAAKRTTTFFDAKIALFSTPTIRGISRIDTEYEFGTQEEWQHQCPNCSEFFGLVSRDMVTIHQIKEDAAGNKTVLVEDVKWQCPACGFEFGELEMKRSAQKYVMKNPAALKNGVRSFWVTGFSSQWLSWREIMREWLEAQGNPLREAVVMNTRFGISYEQKSAFSDEQEYLDRRETYGAPLPDGVLLLTAGVDVQGNRLEYGIYGWGVNWECWAIKYDVIRGDPTQSSTWATLTDELNRTYSFKDGTQLSIGRTFIDSGFSTAQVYDYCRGRRNVFAIKGKSVFGAPLVYKADGLKGENIILFILNVDAGKDYLLNALERMHFGLDDVMRRGFDRNYFKQLTSERRVIRNGREVWEKARHDVRNEALDITVYSLAAAQSIVGHNDNTFWLTQAENLRGKKERPKAGIKQRTLSMY